MKKIIKYWKKSKIRTQIIFTYILILLLSFVMTFSMIWAVNNKYTKEEIGKAGVQTVSALHGNLALVFENVTQLSTYIYFDDIVQDSLRQINSANIDLNYQKNITKSLFNMILSGDYVSGVYIFDQYNNCYSSYKRTPRKVNKYIQGADWYKKMQSAGGNGFFYKGSDGTIEYYENNNYLCYVRQILDKKDYKPLATLLITFDNTVLQGYFNQVSENSKNQFYIINSKGNYVIKPQEEKRDFKKYTKVAENINEGYKEVKNNGEECIVACQDMGIQDWKLVGVFSMDDITSLAPYYSTIIAIIMGINIIFVFLCSTLLTYLIFKPLRKIENHMQIVENGEFITMPVDDYDNEITNLRKVFNHMILSVKALMKRVKDEERIIAKGKLDIIYAQINPHFLYNSLSLINWKALEAGQNDISKLTLLLSAFYRTALNKGNNILSIGEEVKNVRSYIDIQLMMHDYNFDVEIEIPDKMKEYATLNLILQPLVENAIDHGIDLKEDGRGKISIEGKEQKDDIYLIVSDNGIGMEQEKAQQMLTKKSKGYGLRNVKERIELFFGTDYGVTVTSKPRHGTTICIHMPKRYL